MTLTCKIFWLEVILWQLRDTQHRLNKDVRSVLSELPLLIWGKHNTFGRDNADLKGGKVSGELDEANRKLLLDIAVIAGTVSSMTREILFITTEEVDLNIFIVNLAKTITRKSFYNNPSILYSNILTKKR